MSDFDDFFKGYLDCVVWTENDVPLSKMAEKEAKADCKDFFEDNQDILENVGVMEQHGHDFWLTRNGHGAGFWDRGYGKIGDELTEKYRPYGSVNTHIFRNKVFFY